MERVRRERERRLVTLVVFCLLLVGVNLALLWLRQERKSRMQAPRTLVGKNIEGRLKKAGIRWGRERAPVEVILFMGEDLRRELRGLQSELGELTRRGFGVTVVGAARGPEGLPAGVRFFPDSLGRARRLCGLGAKGNAVVACDKKGKTLVAVTEAAGGGALQNVLGTLWLNPRVVAHLPPAKAGAPTTEWGKKLATFPFDSLLRAAEEVVIDLDRVPRRSLRWVRSVGHSEVPAAGEPILGAPIALAADGRGGVFVCDEALNAVLALDCEGNIKGSIAQKGVGPGELSQPTAVAVQDGQLLVVDGCFRLQVFDSTLHFVNSYRLDWGLAPFEGFGVLGNVVCIPFAPLPPYRTKIVHLYEFWDGGLRLVGSFFDYVQPKKRYSNSTGALLTQNRVCLATDGHRFLAVGRPHQPFFFLVHLPFVRARKYVLQGQAIEKQGRRRSEHPVRDYTLPLLYVGMAFDQCAHLHVLLPPGVLEVDPGGTEHVLWVAETPEGVESPLFLGVQVVAIGAERLWGAAPGDGRLDIYSRGN